MASAIPSKHDITSLHHSLPTLQYNTIIWTATMRPPYLERLFAVGFPDIFSIHLLMDSGERAQAITSAMSWNRYRRSHFDFIGALAVVLLAFWIIWCFCSNYLEVDRGVLTTQLEGDDWHGFGRRITWHVFLKLFVTGGCFNESQAGVIQWYRNMSRGVYHIIGRLYTGQ